MSVSVMGLLIMLTRTEPVRLYGMEEFSSVSSDKRLHLAEPTYIPPQA